jgi:cell division protein FtsN
MRIKILLLFFSLFIALFNFYCSSTSYDMEEVEYKDTVRTTKRTEVKQDTETPETEIKEEPVEIQPPVTKEYAIQIGAFQEESHAIETMNKAKERFSYKVNYILMGGLFKVRLGEFNSLPDALATIGRIKEAGFFDSFIVELIKNN